MTYQIFAVDKSIKLWKNHQLFVRVKTLHLIISIHYQQLARFYCIIA